MKFSPKTENVRAEIRTEYNNKAQNERLNWNMYISHNFVPSEELEETLTEQFHPYVSIKYTGMLPGNRPRATGAAIRSHTDQASVRLATPRTPLDSGRVDARQRSTTPQ